MIIFQVYQDLKNGCLFTPQMGQQLFDQKKTIHSHQWSSLACLLSERTESESVTFLKWITSQFPQIDQLLKWQKNCNPETNCVNNLNNFVGKFHIKQNKFSDGYLADFLFCLTKKKDLGKKRLVNWINGIVNEEISLEYTAFCLMTILLKGLKEHDLNFFTQALTASGKVYDYRSFLSPQNVKLIRRYPTGALSEKIALILPSMIAAARHDIPVATSFLVARSLSFTGGTWDKLSSIPGFIFPQPGNESFQILQECGVAMSVTSHDVNPADRILYQLRSATGTVESDELIISSIVSKQLSFPVDHLLMDVRYGEGAFLPTYQHAQHIAHIMTKLLKSNGINASAAFTDTPEPNGSSIGNALEIIEALAILTGNNSFWNEKGLKIQTKLVTSMFAKLFAETFPDRSFEYWQAYGEKILQTGRAYENFWSILKAHSVSEKTIQDMKERPWDLLINTKAKEILSGKTGTLCHIDQKNLGFFVNFTLGGAGSSFTRSFNPKSSIRLNKLIGNPVRKGEILCWVFHDDLTHLQDSDVQEFFLIQ